MNGDLAVGLLGFGEVGRILGDDLATIGGLAVFAYDTQFGSDSIPDRAIQAHRQVAAVPGASDLAKRCNVIISAVTAAEDLAAARSLADGLAGGTYVLDLNSVAPETKRACARIVDDAGGRYVEAALMAPIAPQRIRSPILLGGPHAERFVPIAARLGFGGARVFSRELGGASATKMCRSVIVKGIEALVTESMLAARHYGVERDVLDSLGDVMVRPDWPAYARYLIGRSIEHGVRRAEEMREVAATVREAGVEPLMSAACAARQARAAGFESALGKDTLESMLDEMSKRRGEC